VHCSSRCLQPWRGEHIQWCPARCRRTLRGRAERMHARVHRTRRTEIVERRRDIGTHGSWGGGTLHYEWRQCGRKCFNVRSLARPTVVTAAPVNVGAILLSAARVLSPLSASPAFLVLLSMPTPGSAPERFVSLPTPYLPPAASAYATARWMQ